MKTTSLSLCLATAGALTLNAAPLLYDFGAPGTPVRKNFTPLDAQSKMWSGAKKLFTGKNKIVLKSGINKHSGRSVPPIYYNELTCDHIGSKGGALLTFSVPDGKYNVWILTGRAGGNRSQVWDIKVYSGPRSVSMTYAGPAEIHALELKAAARNGKLSLYISTRSKWIINAIAIVPEKEYAKVKKEILDPEMAELATLPPEIIKKWKKLPFKSDIPAPRWSEKQKKQGFAIFSRNWTEPVWPEQFPRKSEIDHPVRAFTTIGESEPLTFSIYPLKNFNKVTLQVKPFVNEKGNVIGTEQITPRYVKYSWVRPNYNMHGFYYRAPEVLMPWSDRTLKAKEPLRIWLAIDTTPHTVPGIYRSQALLDLDGQKVTVPLTLRVLPFRLLKNPNVTFAQYYHHPYRNAAQAPDDFSRQWWEKRAEYEHAHMRDSGHEGITGSVWFTRDRSGKLVLSFDAMQKQIDLMRKYGMGNFPIPCSLGTGSLYAYYMKGAIMGSHITRVKMPPKKFFDDFTAIVQMIENEARRRNWPELLYYPVDEPSTQKNSVDFMVAILKAIKKVPGVRTYVTADPATPAYAPMKSYVDVWCCQPFSIPKAQAQSDMKKRPGLEYWSYPNHNSGENDHTLSIGTRMTYGFGLWQSGFKVLIPWIYSSCGYDQWNNLDSGSADFGVRTAPDGRPIPTPLWEAYREGIDDGKYLFTLETYIKRAVERGFKKEAAAAQADLELIKKNIFIQPKYRDKNLWAADTFDAYRWLLAENIMKLAELLK